MSLERVANHIREIILGNAFQKFILALILVSAVIVGLETSPAFMNEFGPILMQIDQIIVWLFVGEIALKILAQGRTPLNYFKDGWNVADFLIVMGCLFSATGGAVAVFRLIRVLRVLRLITGVPKLQTIVSALLKSIPSMGYVLLLLAVHFYMYGVLGTVLFSKNDPIHFGSLGKSFLSLFQTLTLEGWVDLMRIQLYGCAEFGYENYPKQCVASSAQPVLAVLYFITFIVLGTMTILNLLIGVVVNGVAESHQEVGGADTTAVVPVRDLNQLAQEVRELKQLIRDRQP